MSQRPPLPDPLPTAPSDLRKRDGDRTRNEPTRDEADCRCLCGNLLARWVEGAVELKCRRCKRTLRVPLAGLSRDGLRPVRVTPVGEAG